MQVEGFAYTGSLDTTVVDYIKELETRNQKLETTNQKLQTTNQELENTLRTINNNLIEYQNKYLDMKEQRDLLLYKKYGASAEKTQPDDKQQMLFTDEDEPVQTQEKEDEEERTEVKSYSRKKPGRKPIDSSIRREERIIDISEEEKICACGVKMTRIGEETSEKLQIIPPRIYVEKIIRPKYACRHCEGTEDEDKPAVRIAPVEPSIIPRSIASPSLLSTVFTQKYEMHLPYYRQEKQFAYIGVEISRQDMSNWQQQVYKKLEPLFTLLKEAVRSGPVIQMDETPVQVIGEEDRKDTQKSYMWLARGGPPGEKVVWYEYHPTRGGKHAKDFLQGYCGYLQTDGYEGYDSAVKEMPGVIQVGCFAHARRKFFEASKATKTPQSAEEGIKHIRKLYLLEDELRSQNLCNDDFLVERKARAGPILEKFKTWLLKRKDEVLDSSLLGKAIAYSLNQWNKMTAYLDSPYLTPDNNACENAIRPFVLGRKNWLFCQSPEGAESSCGIYTLIETAKQNGLVPFNYLMALFEKAPLAVTSEDWKKLLPWNIFSN